MNESIATENCGFEVGVYDLRAGLTTIGFPIPAGFRAGARMISSMLSG